MSRRGATSVSLRRGAACLAVLAGCHRAAVAPSADDDRIAKLRTFEQTARSAIDYAHLPSSESSMGSDPWGVVPTNDGFAGILRGRSQIVFFDADMTERARLPTPRAPMGLAVSPQGDVFVAGSLDPSVARYSGMKRTGTLKLEGALSLRELAWAGPSTLQALDAFGGRVITLALGATDAAGDIAYRRTDEATCRGPIGMVRTEHFRVDNCLFDHELRFTDGTSIKNDGPFWGVAAKEIDDRTLIVAAGGVEDRPLDRSEGFFGYVDSFVYVYKNGTRIASIDVSDHGILTPKALSVDSVGASIVLTVTGYGSDKAATIRVEGGHESVEVRTLVPGVRALAHGPSGLVMASPLLDAWVMERPGAEPRIIPVKDEKDSRSFDTRLGEALIFTSLMAPWNKSDGKLSRFTCETCHFEGYGDGRVHFTGRQDIHAATKPLLGLVGNKPHFSRALDPDLAAVAMNEFRVANAKSDHDPWFALEKRDHPWMSYLGMPGERVAPEELRRAFMTFLMDFGHRPHPALIGRTAFDDEERRGAAVFRDRCEGCHAARLAADDPASRVPFEGWERSIFADNAAIVWATSAYAKTGVLPYVNERGTRIPSLRRLYAKRPYFTNGSARELTDVLSRVRLTNGVISAHAGPDGTPLDASEQRALAAFLSLL